jgi:sulfur-oxidizing protein SoxY
MTEKIIRIVATRRDVLAAAGSVAGGLAGGFGWPASPAHAQLQKVQANPAALALAIRKIVGEATVTPGKVKLDVPPLSENGNSVSLGVTVDSPMTQAYHVKAIHVLTEKNPQPNVISVKLGPRAGRASIATRMRLADTQDVTAIAEMSDGTFWSDKAAVIVTLGACLEDLS